eukprot:11202049-Lingulodinium_polyedra.AAC.1
MGTQRKQLHARQRGGSRVSGGAEAIVITHLAVDDMYHAGRLRRFLTAAQIDEDNCFGRRAWGRLRHA